MSFANTTPLLGTFLRIIASATLCLPLLTVAIRAQESTAAVNPINTTILSASEIDYPPFCFENENGDVDGFSVELLRETLKRVGKTTSVKTGPWPDVKAMLENGEVHVLPLVGRTPERENIFDFTFPYMTLYGAIVVRNDEKKISCMADLRGMTVGVMKDDNAEEYLLREDRGITVKSFPSFIIAFKELSESHCDAVVVQRLVGLRLISENRLSTLRVIPNPIEDFRQDFCFNGKYR